MTLYTAIYKKEEVIAVTDKFGLFNIFGTNGFFKSFSTFEKVKENYKCFRDIADKSLIDYDLPFRQFMDQFESGAKEANCLAEEVKKWSFFKEKLKLIRK